MQNNLSKNLAKWEEISDYSTWMYHSYAKYIGKRIFDVGAGLGRMVSYYIKDCEYAVASDIFDDQVDFMNKTYKRYNHFSAVKIDIMNDDISNFEGKFDTVLCVNVLEHIEDDKRAVERMKSLLMDGGNLILFVPALQKLYCSFDKNVGHHRRYNAGELGTLGNECDMKVIDNHYFNIAGIIPYWIKGRKKNVHEQASFSTEMNGTTSFIYNLASKILEPMEEVFPPPVGLSEVIVLQKKWE